MKKCLSFFLSLVIVLSLGCFPLEAKGMEITCSSSGSFLDGSGENDFDLVEVDPDAVKKVQESLIQHKGMFSVEVSVDNIEEHYVLSYADSIFKKAAEHNGNPLCGDYLAYQISKYFYNCTLDGDITGITLKIRYTVDFFTTIEQEKELTEKVDKIISELDLDGKSDYEKIRAVYDYLTKNVRYDYDGKFSKEKYGESGEKIAHSAYAAICNGVAVCQGYASALYRLLLSVGVDCRIISGDGLGMLHAWNIAAIDGVYYLLDSTWDAGQTDYEYFLRGSSDFTAHDESVDFKTEEFKKAYPVSAVKYEIPTEKKSLDAMFGDVDWDGKITSADSLKVLRVSVKLETLEDYEIQLADVDGSHEINSADSLEILRCSVNLPTSFKKIGTKIEIYI